jgi:hypothetical protein
MSEFLSQERKFTYILGGENILSITDLLINEVRHFNVNFSFFSYVWTLILPQQRRPPFIPSGGRGAQSATMVILRPQERADENQAHTGVRG